MRANLAAIWLSAWLVAASLPADQSRRRNVFDRCILPLGMEEGKIPDDAITASSSYETKSVGPQNARIRQEKNGGAWCPKAQISSDVREYLEVDLTKDHLIAWTETQGRFGNGQGQEYAEAFFLEYWRNEQWHRYKSLNGDRVLRGNSNTYLVEKQKLELPFVASRVRFVPYSRHPRTVCMRVEIYGCLWAQAIAAYSGPRGETRGPGGRDLRDSSYDGNETEGILTGGLGQLTDGILGEAFELAERSSSDDGSNWVGWNRRESVRLVFEFRETREFRNCTIHVARIPELGIEAFSGVRIWLSPDGRDYRQSTGLSGTRIVEGTEASAESLSIAVPIPSTVGKFVRVELDTSSEWLVLSEVTFESRGDVDGLDDLDGLELDSRGPSNGGSSIPATRLADPSQRFRPSRPTESDYLAIGRSSASSGPPRGYFERIGPTPYPALNRTFHRHVDAALDSLNSADSRGSSGSSDANDTNDSSPDAFPVGGSQTYVGLVGGLLTLFALILTCTVFLVKQRGRNKVALLQKHAVLLCGSAGSGIPGIPVDAKAAKLPPNPILLNGLSSLDSLDSLDSREGRGNSVKPAGARARRGSRPSSERDYDTSTVRDQRQPPRQHLPDECLLGDRSSLPSRRNEQSGSGASNFQRPLHRSFRPSATSEASEAPEASKLPGSGSEVAPMSEKPSRYPSVRSFGREQDLPESCYAARDILAGRVEGNDPPSGGFLGETDRLWTKRRDRPSVRSLFTPLSIRDRDREPPLFGPLGIDDRDVRPVSRHRLKILDKLGEGSFGLVHLCEAKGIPNPDSGSPQTRQIVVVRSLWRGVVDSLRVDFARDMRLLSTLRDPNLARVIALLEDEPFGAVFEYGQLGDLPAFLEYREEPLSSKALLDFAAQIASGMRYLESLDIPHCDLAARNCTVGQSLTIKVSDHAVYCGKYDRQYYVDGNCAKIPLRWMAWEAVLLGKRTARGDVWSFAVTIWEILTSCREMPYCDLTAEQVLENCSRWYRPTSVYVDRDLSDEASRPSVLSRPLACPEELYRLMTRCWAKRPEERPTFEEICLFLESLR